MKQLMAVAILAAFVPMASAAVVIPPQPQKDACPWLITGAWFTALVDRFTKPWLIT